jgi:hypothetical protein
MRKLAVILFVLSLVGMCAAQQTPPDKSKRPSPPGTAEATLNGKKIVIEYSRPYLKGRKMIGEHEPYGRPWRAGANEATSLKTDADVDIGGTHVPAGAYTLFILPEPNKMTLIISKKTGEWGIPYPGEQFDLARIPMKLTQTSQPTEQFTISFDKQNENSAQLNFTWENWNASLPVKLK